MLVAGQLYHDHEQTPGWRTPIPNGQTGTGTKYSTGKDGVCHDPITGANSTCNCGKGVDCGEYLWDHRNESLRDWLLNEYIGSDAYGLGNVNIDGFFLGLSQKLICFGRVLVFGCESYSYFIC